MSSTRSIAQCDPRAGYLAHRHIIDAAIARVLESGRYILGQETAAFEDEFARYCETEHAVGVASGTDGIVLALKTLGIGAGDKVLAPSMTAVATVAAIELAGAVPVLADLDPATFTLSTDSVARLLNEDREHRIRAVIAVHLYGHPADIAPLENLARNHGAFLIEDASQAHGARYRGRRVGSFGEVAVFSLYPTKNLGALGDGGIVTTRDAKLARSMRELREYGWKTRYVSERAGMNTRLDEIQAAILRTRLHFLDAGNARRRRIADIYRDRLADSLLVLPREAEWAEHVYHQFVIRHDARDQLRTHLSACGVGTAIHYPAAVHQQPAYAGRLELDPAGLPATEAAVATIMSLPMYPELEEEAVEFAARELTRISML